MSFSCLEGEERVEHIKKRVKRMLRKFASVEFVLNLESLWLVVVNTV